ncbi:hydroxyacyl-CoA dehydrogenase trifunctional multienzyme complex subunit alpha a [Notolabrus celidotus]|uniref:hydroxyacyl-CoA dehydrogenase trifunctional multienzyme complex subunit alpha a n=1 Tax=Notolabrus celidotus TaxID=1203425 RepID=UPI0014907BB6|nr:hydroxyacyl-CoA dehydrogenase trifunctional multienzyme complex subunit alpha a [Notolabrus celidotus]
MAGVRAVGVLSKFVTRKYPLFSGHASRCLSMSSSLAARTHVSYELKDDVAVVRLNDPTAKVNTLSVQMQSDLEEVMGEIWSNKAVKSAVFISSKPGCFIAGADITMIQSCQSSEEATRLSQEGQKMLEKIEKSPIPIVAAIHGSCLGGGLEVAIACHYRIATRSKKTVLGTPEVMLGLLPGAGGTQRLPQMVGLPDAFDMMLTGRTIRADKAKKMGLLHQLVDPLGPGVKPAEVRTIEYLEEIAVGVAKGIVNKKVHLTEEKSFKEKMQDKLMNLGPVKKKIFKTVNEKSQNQTKGLYPAPAKIIECVKTGLLKGREAGYLAESENFGKLAVSEESKSLIGLYRSQMVCKKNHFGVPEREVKKLAILGAGLMGTGVAQVSVDKGLTTILKDNNVESISRGHEQIYKSLDSKVQKKFITSFERDAIMSNLSIQLDYSGFQNADMVVEAVFEDIDMKRRVLKEVEDVIPPHCIFATNTSSLPIKEIAAASKRPDKVIGMHYFSPVNKMQLLEIVYSDETSEDTIAAACSVGLKQGKTIIIVKDCQGFFTTRCIHHILLESITLLLEGTGLEKMNNLVVSFGFPLGFSIVGEEVGYDVILNASKDMLKVYGSRYGGQDLSLLETLVERDFKGRKSGKGLYLWEKGNNYKKVNPEAVEILKTLAKPAHPSVSSDWDIQHRLVSRYVNEALLCLQEGVLRNPVEGDIGSVFSVGFPPCYGGPFRFVDMFGAERLVSTMRRYEEVYGDSFTPCQLLLDHAKDPSKKFYK